MSKKVLVVGRNGSMGRRYMAILKAMGVDAVGVDKDDEWAGAYTYAIVASPTETHVEVASTLCREGIPVLVEKPISTNPLVASSFCDAASDGGFKVRMVNQYLHMPRGREVGHLKGLTFYDYFRSGSDGLVYDCISLIALASGPISLNNKSPIWTCALNGQPLSLADMDRAYCDMVARFIEDPPTTPEVAYIRHAQQKVAKVAAEAQFGKD